MASKERSETVEFQISNLRTEYHEVCLPMHKALAPAQINALTIALLVVNLEQS
jgi:hypothetical protein